MSEVRVCPRVVLHDQNDVIERSASTLYLPTLPSKAFGDGSHPTTRLAARAVDAWCRLERPQSFLDVGTGSGVLARIARAHGVPFVVGTDIDEQSLIAAIKNAALDASATPILFVKQPPRRSFDLVVANILEEVLVELADALVEALAPSARLILSGFTAVQAPRLRALYGERGVEMAQTVLAPDVDGWALLHGVRRAVH